MIIDVNAYLGSFAFRQLRHNTADGLLKLMDAKGIDRAWVSSAASITYRNVQSGNEEVADAVRRHHDRLIPFAVINPFYAGWEDDLDECHKEFGMKGLRLYPKWHNYALSDSCCLDLIDAATERGMLISIPFRAEDYRQRSWLVDVKDVTAAEIVPLVKARPKARFVLLNGVGFGGSPLGKPASGLPANYWIEISRLSAVMANEIGKLVQALGADRVVFGTGMPFNAPDPSLVKMEAAGLGEAEKEKIFAKNAAGLLGVS
jgi:predicted TIM-barrel fold metal-dependent hydrolase